MVNTCIGKHTDKISSIDHLKVGNIKIYDSKVIVNEFGKFFSNIGNDYANRIPKAHQSITSF